MSSVANRNFRSLSNCKKRQAFTLVELLVAMAITLLMMAALARGFAFIGENIRDSRADVQLSSDLRDVTTRLRDELNRCTTSLAPNVQGSDKAGYFMYYEGPITDATTSIFRSADLDNDGNVDLPLSRYGDFDDYLAFTAVAPPGSWFTGKVPQYLLDGGTSTTPVTIKSRYAEIIYYVSPEYDETTLDTVSANYLDFLDGGDFDDDGTDDLSGVPDRMRLHRRVLLIRPDLNRATTASFGGNDVSLQGLHQQTSGAAGFMQPDSWPTANASGTSTVDSTVAGVLTEGWRYGMAAVHQQCDLSLRRVYWPANDDVGNSLAVNGRPSAYVAANTLDDLAQPHNRFGHVRIPAGIILGTGGNAVTSMPLLALGETPTILTDGLSVSPTTGAVGTPSDYAGFLHPAFVLGSDLVHHDDPNVQWGLARLGEDVVVDRLLAFDLKIFDSNASWVQDSSTTLILGPNDPGYRERLTDSSGLIPVSNRSIGGFVDLCYPMLAGGSIRGWGTPDIDLHSGSASDQISINANLLITDFSGVRELQSTAAASYVDSLFLSGRTLLDAGGGLRCFQPAFDTYTTKYETDGYIQQEATAGGSLWSTASGGDTASDGLDNDGQFGADDFGERTTLPPFTTQPEAIQISVRLEDVGTRQVRQTTVVHSGR